MPCYSDRLIVLPFNTKGMSVSIQRDDTVMHKDSKVYSERLPPLRLCRGGVVRSNRRRSRPNQRRAAFHKARSWDDLQEPSSPVRSLISKKFSASTVNDFRPIRPRRSSLTIMGGYDQCESVPITPWSPVRGYQTDVGGDAVPKKPRRSSMPSACGLNLNGGHFMDDEGDETNEKEKRQSASSGASGNRRRDACPVKPRRSSVARLDVARKSIFCSATA